MMTALIPSAMTDERLALMQGRAERGESLAQEADSDAVPASIKRRGKKVAKDGHAVLARSVGHRAKQQQTKVANYTENGDEIEPSTEFSDLDKYLECVKGLKGPLTGVGRQSLDAWLQRREGINRR